MASSRKGQSGPIPAGNQSPFGPANAKSKKAKTASRGAPASDKDPKGRLGNYAAAGESPIEQPDGKQGADH